MKYSEVRLSAGITAEADSGGASREYLSEADRHRPFGNFHVMREDAQKVFADVTPRRGEEFTRLELPIGIESLTGIGLPPFNAVIAKTSDGWTVAGWIDSFQPVSVGAKECTAINWHIDWWITAQLSSASGQLRLLEGRIKRGPKSIARPDPSEPRMWEIVNRRSLSDTAGQPWVLIYFTQSAGDSGTTTFEIAFWKIGNKIGTLNTLTVEQLYHGVTEEYLGIAPSAILGAWLSPVRPCLPTATGVSGVNAGTGYGYCKINAGYLRALDSEIFRHSSAGGSTDDMTKTVVADPYGAVLGTVPWGLQFDTVDVGLDIGANGANARVYFAKSDDTYKVFPGCGREIDIPLISVPITSNATSEYVYSGQRDYDVYTAQLQAEQARKSGIANAGTSIIGGAVAGAMVGNAAGAALGAVGGAASSIISSQVTYGLTREYNAKEQQAVDRLTANQIPSAVLSAGGSSWVGSNNDWELVTLQRDAISKAELETEQAEIGYLTDSQCYDCGAYVEMGGPLKIEGLRVEGLSPEGNAAVSALFARGVYIDLF